MSGKTPTVIFDEDNPEWTEADFERGRPIADFPELAAAFPNGSKLPGRPKGSMTSQKQQVALRLDKEVLERFRAGGAGWQTRMNEALRKAVGL